MNPSSNLMGKIVLQNCINERIDQGRSYINENVNVSDCFFMRFKTFGSNGGVISIDGGSFYMHAKSSIFLGCEVVGTPGHGGAIFFNSFSIKLSKICANNC